MLDQADVGKPAENAEVWEKVVAKLRAGVMPPVRMPRPDKAASASLLTWLETQLDQASTARPNAGRPAAHRLNRAEYENAVRDLLAVEIDGRSLLPADDSDHGFDNVADALSVTSGLMERYLIVAQKVSRLAVGDTAIQPETTSYKATTPFRQTDRVGEALTFGTWGGIGGIRHNFPVNGEYSFRITLQRSQQLGYVRGVSERHVLEVRLDGDLLKRFVVFCDPRQTRGNAADVASYGDDCSNNADANLEVRVPIEAGTHIVGAAFLRNPGLTEGLTSDRVPIAFGYTGGIDTQLSIAGVNISGPYGVTGPGESASRHRIFVCRPNTNRSSSQEVCAKKILSTLARRAYRRPVSSNDVNTLQGFYERGRDRSFDAGIQLALERILIDPDFLFRTEHQPPAVKPGISYRLTDIELASRLSFFLWSSIPDDELLDLAVRGRLKEPSILRQQVVRMIADERSKALVKNFGGQWLFLRNLRVVAPDPREFPDFDDNLREAMQQETELFLSEQLKADHPLSDMVRANYSFINERLAEHYGIPNVYGSHFRRVTYPDDRRAGIFGQAALLVATNTYPNRTSPVKRGVWLLDNVFGVPPPAPPPDVPPFPEASEAKPQTVRERMEQHRKNPVCATCHAQIDPLGFALENFDALGQWRDRDRDADVAIDSASQLPDGSTFNGPVELRKLIVTRREEFVATVTKKLLTYALGRGVEYYDMPAVRKIVREAAPVEYRWSSLIYGIVNSVPFQMRSSVQ